MIKPLVLLSAAFAVSACATGGTPQQSETGVKPTQLELSIGLQPDEWGQYTSSQLTIIKSLQDSSNISQGEADRRTDFVKKNPPTTINFF